MFGGDFQQTLPVVVHGTRADSIHSTIQASYLWSHIVVLHLRRNMRVIHSEFSAQFSQWLLQIGRGRDPPDDCKEHFINLPHHMRRNSESDLIDSVYTSLRPNLPTPPSSFFKDRAILAATNDDVRSLNERILARFPGEEHIYDSADSYSIDSPSAAQNTNVPVEFLHSINASGLPLSHLALKKGCPVLILRNIDVSRGLCNGTHATVLHMTNRIVEVLLLNGDHAGEAALIPRITISPSVTGIDSTIKLNRRQFPLQLALAMTINRAQGQSLNHIGVDLRKPVFAHGQLYVALSRATSPANVSVLLPPSETSSKSRNVVYNEVLLR